MKKGSQKDPTKAQTSHNDNGELHETMALQSLRGNSRSENHCTKVTEPRGEPHELALQGKVGWKDQHNEQSGEIPTSNS